MTIRVLLVDDDALVRAGLRMILSSTDDIDVVGEAADGDEAVAATVEHRPDVILMDIHLPGISGMDAMKILRADPSTAHIPIIALSANAVPRDIAAALEAGFFGYLTKPIEVNLFMEALNGALGSSDTESGLSAEKETA